MALSSIALCSRALLKIGTRSISSFDEGTAEAEVASSLYSPTRDAMLSSHSWSFATAQATLPRLDVTPVADYQYAFQLPSDFLRVLSAGVGRGHGLDYRIQEKRLHADTPEVVLSYVFRPDETDFPPFFDQALIARLAGEFCIPLTDSTSRAETLLKIADVEAKRARITDTMQETTQAIEDYSLVKARG